MNSKKPKNQKQTKKKSPLLWLKQLISSCAYRSQNSQMIHSLFSQSPLDTRSPAAEFCHLPTLLMLLKVGLYSKGQGHSTRPSLRAPQPLTAVCWQWYLGPPWSPEDMLVFILQKLVFPPRKWCCRIYSRVHQFPLLAAFIKLFL